MLARPEHNEPLRETFEVTAGYSPAFLAKLRQKRQEASKKLGIHKHIDAIRDIQRERGITYSLKRLPEWIAEIIMEEAEKIDIPPDAILLPVRSVIVVEARDAAIYRVKAKSKISLPKLGQFFGGRDHTSMVASLVRYADKHDLPRLTKSKSYEAKKRRAREYYHNTETARLGFVCDECGSLKMKVVETRQRNDGLHRRRECVDCGARFSTVESRLDS